MGKFMGQGIHIGRESSLPLPLLGIVAESKEDIALQLSMGLELLSICSGVPVKELMEQVDALFTDSVEHNKGVNFILMEMFGLLQQHEQDGDGDREEDEAGDSAVPVYGGDGA